MGTREDAAPELSAADAAAMYSTAAGIEFEVVSRLSDGETGATEIRSGTGERRVLKWESEPANIASRVESARLAERLRAEAS